MLLVRKNEIHFGKGREHCQQRRKYRIPVFPPFPNHTHTKNLSRDIKVDS